MLDAILHFRFISDTADIIIVALIIYYILRLIEGTRAVQMLFGLASIFVLYFLSQKWELYTLNWILDHFLGSIILIVVILFQNDIRRALTAFGGNPLGLKTYYRKSEQFIVDEIVKATSLLASRRIGALIAIERKDSLADFVEVGMRLDAWVSRELIITIFNKDSPLHDGGMIDQDWLNYQHEIGLRHHRTKKNKTDKVQSVPNISHRYIVAFIYPITATIKPFLAKKGNSPDEVEKMHQAWFKSVVLQVALWSYPYVKEGDF